MARKITTLVDLQDEAAPGALSNIQSGGADLDLTPAAEGLSVLRLIISASFENATQLLVIRDGGVPVILADTGDLLADGTYSFEMPATAGGVYNFQISVDGLIRHFRVEAHYEGGDA